MDCQHGTGTWTGTQSGPTFATLFTVVKSIAPDFINRPIITTYSTLPEFQLFTLGHTTETFIQSKVPKLLGQDSDLSKWAKKSQKLP